MIAFFANSSGAGQIRGRQMAQYLGARLNPAVVHPDDVAIYVKRQPHDDRPKRSYLDIVDAHERIPWLKHHEDVGVIASSRSARRYLERKLARRVKLIPQHHCNFERATHEWQDPPRLGVVGGRSSLPDWIAALYNIKRFGDYRTREDVVAAYMQIDIQVIWRGLNRPLKNALKIINAASFGIPTIALPEIGYEEMNGFYTHVQTPDEIRPAVRALIQIPPTERLVEKAEEYHIEHISKVFADL